MLSVNERFARWLRLCGYSQKEIADQLGRNKTYVTRLKTGERRPNLDDAVRIEILSGIPAVAWAVQTPGRYSTHAKTRRQKTKVA